MKAALLNKCIKYKQDSQWKTGPCIDGPCVVSRDNAKQSSMCRVSYQAGPCTYVRNVSRDPHNNCSENKRSQSDWPHNLLSFESVMSWFSKGYMYTMYTRITELRVARVAKKSSICKYNIVIVLSS